MLARGCPISCAINAIFSPNTENVGSEETAGEFVFRCIGRPFSDGEFGSWVVLADQRFDAGNELDGVRFRLMVLWVLANPGLVNVSGILSV